MTNSERLKTQDKSQKLSFMDYIFVLSAYCAMSSNAKRSEICIREQFVTWMVRYGGEIENCDFHKGKESNVGLFGMSYLLRYKATGVLKNCVERCQNSRFTANK